MQAYMSFHNTIIICKNPSDRILYRIVTYIESKENHLRLHILRVCEK